MLVAISMPRCIYCTFPFLSLLWLHCFSLSPQPLTLLLTTVVLLLRLEGRGVNVFRRKMREREGEMLYNILLHVVPRVSKCIQPHRRRNRHWESSASSTPSTSPSAVGSLTNQWQSLVQRLYRLLNRVHLFGFACVGPVFVVCLSPYL